MNHNVLVCGSRTFANPKDQTADVVKSHREFLLSYLDKVHSETPITLIIEGEAPGADSLAREWAEERGIPVEKFPADWNGPLGKGAGPVRNSQMLAYLRTRHGKKVAIAFIDKPLAESRGTHDMVTKLRQASIDCYVEWPDMPEGRLLP